MKIAVFTHEGTTHTGIVEGDSVVVVDEIVASLGDSWSRAVAAAAKRAAIRPGTGAVRFAVSDVHLHAPARPSKIIAVGLNYRNHIAEAGLKLPSDPVIFAKFPNSVTGPFDPIVIPRENPNVDWEAELGVVIGRRGKRIRAEEAIDYVAGYVAFNDVSARVWQFQDRQWTRGKSCDTFSPFGPFLVTPDEIPDVDALPVIARVNGEVMQQDTTANLMFRVPQLIEFISQAITLEPGDVIATGTPEGVGVFRKPPVFLKAGDVVEVEIGGVGTLRNPVVMEE